VKDGIGTVPSFQLHIAKTVCFSNSTLQSRADIPAAEYQRNTNSNRPAISGDVASALTSSLSTGRLKRFTQYVG
jgi:hypothetical protein